MRSSTDISACIFSECLFSSAAEDDDDDDDVDNVYRGVTTVHRTLTMTDGSTGHRFSDQLLLSRTLL